MARHELERHNAHGPPVDRPSLACPAEHLGSHVLWSAAYSKRLAYDRLGQYKIMKLRIAALRNEDVFRFHISVDKPFLVDMSKRANDASDVKPGMLLHTMKTADMI